ncbi:MAG: hypothetical protein ACI4I6_09505 [Hominimerdicola sp.]
MPENVGALEITIQKSSDASTFNLKDLKEEIKKLKEETKGGIKGLTTTAKHLDRLNKSINNIPFDKLKKLSETLSELKGLGKIDIGIKGNISDKSFDKVLDKAKNLKTPKTDLSDTTTVSDETVDKVSRLSIFMDKLKGSADKAKDKVSKLNDKVKKAGHSAKDTSNHFKKFLSSLGRIAFYRAIRSAIRGITQSLKEGKDNLYQWSKMQEDVRGNAFSKSLDTLSSSFLYLKNSIAAAFAPLINSIAPHVKSAIENIVNGINYLSKALATLLGQDYYYKATYSIKEYAKAEDSANDNAKELKKTLLGIDELNVLESNKDTTSKKEQDIVDYSGMFEKVMLGKDEQIEWAANLRLKFKDIFPDFSDTSAEATAKRIIGAAGALIGTVIGFSLGGVPGAVIGGIAGIALTGWFNDMTFDNDGKVSGRELFESIKLAVNALVGAGVGFVLGGKVGAAIGTLAGVGLTIGFNKLNGKLLDGASEDTLLDSIFGVGGALTTGIIVWKLTKSPKATVLAATIGTNLSITFGNLLLENVDEIRLWIAEKLNNIYDAFVDVWNGIVDKLENVFGKTDFLEKLRLKTTDEKLEEFKENLPKEPALHAKLEFDAVLHPDFNNNVQKFNDAAKDKSVKLTISGKDTDGKISGLNKAVNGIFDKNNKTSNITVNGKETGSKVSSLATSTKSVFGKDGKTATVSVNGKETGTKTSTLWSRIKSIFSKNDKTVKIKADAQKTKTFDSVFGTTAATDTGTQFGKDFATGFRKQLNKEDLGFNIHVSSSGKTHGGGGTTFATGGHPKTGELFYANELKGGLPEMVGTINHQPTVATNPDIVAAVSQGVARAVSGSMGNANGDVNVNVYIDGQPVYDTVVKYNNQNTIRTGKNALA